MRETSERLEQSDSFVEGELIEFEDENLPSDDEDDGAKTPSGEEVNSVPEDSAVSDD